MSEISFVKAIDISAFLITAIGLMASTGGSAGAIETPAGCLAGIETSAKEISLPSDTTVDGGFVWE